MNTLKLFSAPKTSLTYHFSLFGWVVSLSIFQLLQFVYPALSETPKRDQFWCAKLNGVFTTFYFNKQGQRMSLFAWDRWETPQYSHQRRCEEVSSRLQTIYDSGEMSRSFLYSDTTGSYPVVCINTCNRLLITFPPVQNPTIQLPNTFINALSDALAQVRPRNAAPVMRLPDGLISYDKQGRASIDMSLWLNVANAGI